MGGVEAPGAVAVVIAGGVAAGGGKPGTGSFVPAGGGVGAAGAGAGVPAAGAGIPGLAGAAGAAGAGSFAPAWGGGRGWRRESRELERRLDGHTAPLFLPASHLDFVDVEDAWKFADPVKEERQGVVPAAHLDIYGEPDKKLG